MPIIWCLLVQLLFFHQSKSVNILQVKKNNILSMTETKGPLSEDDNYWTGACSDPSSPQSPIPIKPPFSFMSFNPEFNFRQVKQTFIAYRNRELRIEADFGDLVHENKTFSSYLMVFKCPAEHTAGADSNQFPFELQLYFIDSNGIHMNMAFLFNYDD